MADNSKQGFLNTLFQWTVKNTSEDPTANTPSDLQPMNEEVNDFLFLQFKICCLFFISE